MTLDTSVLAAGITVATGIALLTASGISQYIGHRHPAAPTQPPAPAVLWLPCHQPTCGHMATPHDPTPAGPPTCRWCTEATNGDTQ